MAITVFCSACGTKFRLDDRHAGRRFSCNKCGQEIVAPAPPPTRAESASPQAPAPRQAAPRPAPAPPSSPRASSAPPPTSRASSGAAGASQSFTVYCPGCGNGTQATAALIGKKVRCKRCSETFRVELEAQSESRDFAPSWSAPAARPAPRMNEPDLLSNLDALIDSAASQSSVPLAPLPAAAATPLPPVVKASPRRFTESRADDTWDSLWGTIALAYLLLSIVGLVVAYTQIHVILVILLAFFLFLSVPATFCYLIALFRMGYYGNWGYTALCIVLTGCGIGPLVALAMCAANKDRWRMDNVLPIWAGLVGLSFLLGIAGFATAQYRATQLAQARGGNGNQRQAVQPPAPQQMPAPVAVQPASRSQVPAAAAPPAASPHIDDSPSFSDRVEVPYTATRRKRPPPKNDSERITYALDDLRLGDVFARQEAAKSLAAVPPTERRAEVARALEKVLADDESHFARDEALTALSVWGTQENAQAVARMLEGDHLSPKTAVKAMNSLAALKDPRTARAITKQLFTFNAKAALTALRDMGPAAEEAVLALLEHQDPTVRVEMCSVLEEIGTSRSIAPLKKRSSDDRMAQVKEAAKTALAAVRERAAETGGRPAAKDILKRVPK